MILNNLYTALQEIYPSVTYIFANDPKGVEPKSVYCMLVQVSDVVVGRQQETFRRLETEDQRISRTLNTMFRLQFVGDIYSSARDDAENLMLLLSGFNARSSLYRNGLSVLDVKGVDHISITRDTKKYEGHIITLNVLHSDSILISNPTINNTTITGTIESDGGTIITVEIDNG